MSHGVKCTVHKVHRPWVSDGENHHIWPLGLGGPDVPENIVGVCPTGHTNIHNLLRLAMRHDSIWNVPWRLRWKWPVSERRIVEQAEQRMRKAGVW